MRETRNAIVTRLLSLSAVTSRVSTFRGQPAIFAMDIIPPTASGRYIAVRDAHIDVAFETKQPDNPPADYVPTIGREVHHDIGIYEDTTGDDSVLADLGRIVRQAFHRHPLACSGYGTLIARADGPINSPNDDDEVNQVNGRIVTVALTVIQQ